jgi:hypothetical protein
MVITIQDIQDTLKSWTKLSGVDADASIREAHAKLLFPNDKLSWALSYLSGWTGANGKKKFASTCALVTRAYLRSVWGLHTKELDLPYEHRVGMAFSDVKIIGQAYDAWTSDKDELSAVPDIGDSVEIGDDAGGGIYHVLNVMDYNSANGAIISVDGGQVEGVHITTRERLLIAPSKKPFDKGVWLVDPNTPYRADGSPNGRIVSGKISAKKLATKLGFVLI